MSLFVDWETIEMDHAVVQPHVELRESKQDNKLVKDFFNWVFGEMLPWVNEYHPPSVSMFPIQENFPGIINISELTMQVRDHFISFGMNPEIMIWQGEP